ncbi:MAG: hypothetical protein AABX52_01865 [Nanoarchaeota archaeon]
MTLTLIDARACSLEQVVLSHVQEKTTIPTDLYDAYGRELLTYQQKFKAGLAQGNVHVGDILGLAAIEYAGDSTVFKTNQFSFEEYTALRDTAQAALLKGERVDPRLLASQAALSMITLVESLDNHLIFCHRGGDHLANRYLPPGGFYNYDTKPGKEFLRGVIFDKVYDRVGVKSFGPVTYLGTSHDDRDSFLFVNVFYQQLPVTSREVYELWKKTPAHSNKPDHLLFVSSGMKPLTDYLFHNGDHTFNQYSDPPITFKKKAMISGPANHVKREYQHIENGVGAILLYIAHKYGKKTAASFSQDLVSEKVVSGVDATPLHTGDLNSGLFYSK